MADKERDAALRALARHRGLKLVTSRRRKRGGDRGRYALADAATGEKCFGFGKDGLEATGEDIEAYLRAQAEATWRKSAGARALRR